MVDCRYFYTKMLQNYDQYNIQLMLAKGYKLTSGDLLSHCTVVLLFLFIQTTREQCHGTCLNCAIDGSAFDCTSCNPAHHRTLVGIQGPCQCDVGYYDNANTNTNPICLSPCQYTCPTLCQGTTNNCTACPSGSNRILVGSSCNCLDGFYDSSSTTCTACHNRCKTCTGSTSSDCNSCKPQQNRYLSGGICYCLSGYLDNADICTKCSYKCSTCSGTISTCGSCSDSTRNSGSGGSGPSSCNCPTTLYYDDGTAVCKSCHYSCYTCSSGGSCLTCDSSKNRVYSSVTGLCACKPRYYETGAGVVTCGSCANYCVTCSGALNTNCLSCNEAAYRILNIVTGACDCISGYYHSGSQLCTACHSTCLTCSGSGSTACSTCDNSIYRIKSGNSCICMDGYYNSPSNQCISCHTSCKTCSTNSSCDTCNSPRTRNAVTLLCECASNATVWNASTLTCDTCNYKCATCSVITTNCTSCDYATNKRYLSGNTCLCFQGYYDTGASACSPCSNFRCLSCDGSGCLTCNSSAYRVKSLTNCICMQGFYDDNTNQLCKPCHATCLTCSSSAASNNCASCDTTTYHRTLSTNTCVCATGFYDAGLSPPICQACSTRCATCTTNSTNCGTCSGTNRGSAPTCSCNGGYYDNGVDANCVACHYSCQTCTNASACLTCQYATNHRVASASSAYCVCGVRYYDDNTNAFCLVCHQTCLTCSTSGNTNCLSCNATAQRTLNVGTGKCDCLPNFYQTSATVQLCAACHATCLTCTGTAATNCQSCNATLLRTLNTNKCDCIAKYYSDASNQCQPCHSSCATCTNPTTCDTCGSTLTLIGGLCTCASGKVWDSASSTCINCDNSCTTCSGTSTNCTSCDISTKFRVLNNNTCKCTIKYYEVGSAACSPCSYSCMTCAGASTTCTSCNATAFRTLTSTTCPCIQGYYNQGTNQLCKACDATCLTCSTSATNCGSCDSTTYKRALSGSTCPCQAGYYDAGLYPPICQACSNRCATCSTNSTNCGTCAGSSTRNAAPTCACKNGYFDNEVDAACASCHYSCLTCSSGSSCVSCDASKFRTINQATTLCGCKVRYYDDGTNNMLCQACHAICLTCSTSGNTNCLTCNTTAYRTLNTGTGKCDCMPNFYQTGSTTQLCSACHTTCLTCTGANSNNCQTCNGTANRAISTNTCPCVAGYFSDANLVCQPCHSSCATCSSLTTCATCPYPVQQTINAVTGVCQCASPKIWDAGSLTCATCNYQCSTCSVVATNCTSCNLATNKRVLVANSCPCVDRYYDNGAPVCAACSSYKCLTCDSTGCLTCNSSAYRTKNLATCDCLGGYYDDGSNQLCKICHYTCLTCTSSATNCVTCDGSTEHRVKSGSNCNCIDSFYDVGLAICLACTNKCATCTLNSTNCGTCAGSSTRNAAPNCLCKDGYYQDYVSTSCPSCHYSCKTCTNGSACTGCDGTKNRMVNPVTVLCVCKIRYYDDGSNQNCASCHATCLTCYGSLSTDCLTCNASAHRVLDTSNDGCDCMPHYYQTLSSVQLCANCHPTCLTCNGPNSNDCLTCDLSQKRQISTNSCPCMATYYSDASYICQGCHPSCATCSNSSKCITCPSNKAVDPITGQCACTTMQAWNSGTSACDSCHYSCATCSVSTTNCTTCDNTTNHRVIVNNTCPCAPGFYNSGTNAVCQACHYSCYICTSSGSSACTSCSPLWHRTISSSSCICDDGYFNVASQPICQACKYTCKTCTGSSTCASCNDTLYRELNSGQCNCMTKYYEDSGTLTCKPCLYFCATCGNGSRCLTCASAKNRELNVTTTLCQCKTRFYDDGSNQLCPACLYDCLTCTDASSCTTCDATTDKRQFNPSSFRCTCINYYYENTTPNPPVCARCHYTCLTCTGPGISQCLKCTASANRVFNVATNRCPCKDGYYDDGSNEMCLTCLYSCKTCNAAGSCASCSSGTSRTLDGGLCKCPTSKYFDNGVSQFCFSCQYTCNTCTNLTKCDTCNATRFRTFDVLNQYCVCIDKYYDDGYGNELCLSCPYQCKTCTNASVCATCDSLTHHRHLPAQVCKCMDGYYDNLTANPVCAPCQYTCKTCMVGNQCLTCNPLKFRVYNPTTHYCSCLAGYYDTGTSNQICAACHYSCATCETTNVRCLTCNTTYLRTFNPTLNTCPCNKYYYDDLVNPLCLVCDYTCLTCTNPTTCATCDATSQRIPDPNNNKCKCAQRYYDDGNSNRMCATCQGTCLTCVNANACTSCDTTALRLLNTTADYTGTISPFCVCQYKYYPQANPQHICLICHYTCAVCNGSLATNCLYCTADAHRTFNSSTKSCPCNIGYFDNGTNTETCLACHPWCAVCTSPATIACTACVLPYFLKHNITSCFDTCPTYFFGNTSTYACDQCSWHCKICTDTTTCTLCDTGFPLYKGECYSSCPLFSTYTDAPNNICIDCPISCKTCESSINCTSCVTNFYLDNQLDLCFACNQYCKGCTGPAQNQCLDCAYPLYLKNNQCFNISCPYGQYVDSHSGCLNCSSHFANSLTCTITQATLCQKRYKVLNGVCQYCTNVPGYAITSTGDCSQVCGDGKLLDYECDDGNTLNGDGCSANCLIQKGWHCSKNSSGSSQCILDGAVQMTLNKIYKYPGQNKVKLYITLSIAIRLNPSLFSITFIGLKNPNSISWSLYQNQLDLTQVELTISYTEDISNKQIQISYNQARRRLLQTSLTFETTFTIQSFPPANYYPDQLINQYNLMKRVIYVGCIILLILCGFNFVFPRKMYIHIFPAACIPAQLYIYYGLASENYTDWIKWNLYDLSRLSFIGGFKIGNTSATNSDFLNYTYQITQNTGIVTCVMLGLWIIYGFMALAKRYLCQFSVGLSQVMMYFRYVTLSLQFCLLPHMAYSAVNALYHSSLNSQTESINVCLAIFINVYLLGLIAALFIMAKNLKPHPLMIEAQQIDQQLSMQENISEDNNKNAGLRDNLNESRQELKQMSETRQIIFVNANGKKKQDPIIENESRATQRVNSDQSQERQGGFYTRRSSRLPIQPTKREENGKEDKAEYVEYSGVGYFQSNLEVYKKMQENYLRQWLIYDYVELYATGSFKENLKIIPQGAQQNLDAQLPSNQLVLRKFSNTKYYLPISISKLYILSLVASVAQANIFILYIILQAFCLAYFFYILMVRPFKFGFSVFRILVIEICFLSLNGLITYYSYGAHTNGGYWASIQKAIVIIMIVTVLSSIVLLGLETIGSWRMEIWNKLEPWLVAMRLRGARKVMKYKKYKPKTKSIEKPLVQKKQQQKQQQMDAFFARMLKKEAIQRQYRRERFLKNPKIVLN